MKKACLPPTAFKAAMNTCDKVNFKIREQTVCCLNTYFGSDPAILSEKIRQLNREWDIERFLETHAASITVAGSILGYRKSKCCWFLLTGVVGCCLLQHALQGWCPPLSVLRALGVRTAEEISAEKGVLKRMRGDFLQDTSDVSEMLAAAEKQ